MRRWRSKAVQEAAEGKDLRVFIGLFYPDEM
jgi:hypothetical protein